MNELRVQLCCDLVNVCKYFSKQIKLFHYFGCTDYISL